MATDVTVIREGRHWAVDGILRQIHLAEPVRWPGLPGFQVWNADHDPCSSRRVRALSNAVQLDRAIAAETVAWVGATRKNSAPVPVACMACGEGGSSSQKVPRPKATLPGNMAGAQTCLWHVRVAPFRQKQDQNFAPDSGTFARKSEGS